MEEDRRAVLCAPVRALAVELGGIVVLPENLQQVGVGDLGGIEVDLDGFCVASPIGADLLIGRIVGMATDVTHAGRSYTRKLPKCGFNSPKTACGECCFLHRKTPSDSTARTGRNYRCNLSALFDGYTAGKSQYCKGKVNSPFGRLTRAGNQGRFRAGLLCRILQPNMPSQRRYFRLAAMRKLAVVLAY